MWIDEHPYLAIYLIGCVFVLILMIFKMTLFWFIDWITKGDVLKKNLKKLNRDDESFRSKVVTFVLIVVFEVVLSWINVIVATWQIITTLLKVARETLASTPEAIKVLRFPLKNNPSMSREAVWAYLQALNIKAGGQIPEAGQLLGELNQLHEWHASFDREAALNQLKVLNVLSADVISSALDCTSTVIPRHSGLLSRLV